MQHSARKPRVLVVDDDAAMLENVADGLSARGFEVVTQRDAALALQAMERGAYDALVTDLRMPKHDGLDLLERSRAAAPERPVIVMTAFSGIDSAIESIRRGAYHYVTKPFKNEELALFLRRALDEAELRKESRSLKQALRRTFALENLIGDSEPMRELVDMVRRVADALVPVLILGETGTGKGMIARALHGESSRAERPFVAVNCAALPEPLLESELFGHVKGAFTGATSDRMGLFEAANRGTLFLDEVGEMSPSLQAKLLRVLETNRVRPVGDTQERTIDVRLIAATHRDLKARVAEGQFREDLLYRLDVISVEAPPLRMRRDDIPSLVEYFLQKKAEKHSHVRVRRVSAEAMQALLAYSWPGNVRELEHAIERIVVLSQSSEAQLSDLPKQVVNPPSETQRIDFGQHVLPMREMQRRYVTWAFEQCGNEKRRTCDALDIDYKTLVRYLG